MKKIIAAFGLLFAVPAFSMGSDWTYFLDSTAPDNSPMKIYVHLNASPAFPGEPKMRRTWVAIDFNNAQFVNEGVPHSGEFKSSRYEYLIDCRFRKLSIIQASEFSGNGLSGEVLANSVITDTQARENMRDAAPGSSEARIADVTCL